MNDWVERPLNDEENEELLALSSEGARRIGVAEADDPGHIIEMIMHYVDAVRPLEGDALVHEAPQLGCLWGQQFPRILSWVWAVLENKDGLASYGVVSGDRAFVIFPTSYLRELLASADPDNTTLLLFHMIRAGNVPDCEPGAYEVLG